MNKPYRIWICHMDVLDRIELCQQIIRQSGIEIRAEDLSGTESGVCELNGKKLLMLDLSLSTTDQLEILEEVVEVLNSLSSRRSHNRQIVA